MVGRPNSLRGAAVSPRFVVVEERLLDRAVGDAQFVHAAAVVHPEPDAEVSSDVVLGQPEGGAEDTDRPVGERGSREAEVARPGGDRRSSTRVLGRNLANLCACSED